MRKTAQALLLSFMLVMPMDLMAQAQLGACTQYEDNRGVKIRLHPRSFADKVQCPGEPNCPNKPFKIEGKENFPSEAIGPFDARNNAEKRRGNYTLGCRGRASWQFVDNAIVDVPGPDIVIFEIGNPEPFNVEISTDGKNWVYVGRAAGGTSYIDIKPYAQPGNRATGQPISVYQAYRSDRRMQKPFSTSRRRHSRDCHDRTFLERQHGCKYFI